jgi:hypothetical protein
MPRTKGAKDIRPWDAERMIRDMAVADKSDVELAAEYDVAEQTIRYFRMNHKHEIADVLADWTSKFDHIWSTKKENGLRVLTQRLEEVEDQIAVIKSHARRETETIRSVDPDASEVPYNGPEYRAYVKVQDALITKIWDATGQLPQRVGKLEMDVKNPLSFGGRIAQDDQGNWYAVQQ